jgi:hypothetical protein
MGPWRLMPAGACWLPCQQRASRCCILSRCCAVRQWLLGVCLCVASCDRAQTTSGGRAFDQAALMAKRLAIAPHSPPRLSAVTKCEAVCVPHLLGVWWPPLQPCCRLWARSLLLGLPAVAGLSDQAIRPPRSKHCSDRSRVTVEVVWLNAGLRSHRPHTDTSDLDLPAGRSCVPA